MNIENWKEEFKRLSTSISENKGFFPYGGDSYDFDEANCMEFISSLALALINKCEEQFGCGICTENHDFICNCCTKAKGIRKLFSEKV